MGHRSITLSVGAAALCGSLYYFCFASLQSTMSETARFAVESTDFDIARMQADLREISKQPHPFGSTRQSEIAEFIRQRLQKMDGAKLHIQKFSATVPVSATNPLSPLTETSTGSNLFAILHPERSCVILLGGHYDTKSIPGIEYLGANDSGSSTVALLHLFESMSKSEFPGKCSLGFVWFDGEEAVLDEWNDGILSHPARLQDNTYGSRHFVAQLISDQNKSRLQHELAASQPEVRLLVLLDMIGSPDQKISRDKNSTPELLSELVSAASDLGLSSRLSESLKSIEDDHIPFLQRGIPSLNIIDFENIYLWHNARDTEAFIDYESIKAASRLAIYIAAKISKNP